MTSPITRRTFLKVGVAGGAAVFLPWRFTGPPARAIAAPLASGLDPHDIPQFVTPMLVPPVMPRAGRIRVRAGRNIDYYDLAVRQFEQQILPPGLPATTVWGYGPRTARNGPAIFHAPSLTIEAKHGTPVRVRWSNELRVDPSDPQSDFLPHLLPVDPTLHWANPPGGVADRDSRPDPRSTSGSYRGPVPIVTHVHGRSGSVTRAMAIRKRGSCPAPATSRRHMPPRAPGTTSSGPRRRRRASPPRAPPDGSRARPSSSTRTASAPPRSGITTTRWV